METYDAIVIGAGHNGLVCAAYLLQAGYKVLVLEKNDHLGGATTTEELIPGFRYNPCAVDHILIHLAPVVEELQLRKYGLEYRFCDPSLFCPHPDGKYFFAHRSLEKTCAEIERYHPQDARRYQEFIEFWQRVLRVVMRKAPVFAPGDISEGLN